MSPSPSENFLGPARTPFPPTYSISNRKRKYGYPIEDYARSPNLPRQVVADQAEVAAAEQECEFDAGNFIISCFPTAGTIIPQHQWATFVWNSRRPEITQTNLVDIFLFHADSLTQVLHFANQTNPTDQSGVVRAQVNDTWWGTNGANWAGQNISYPYFWVIIRSDSTLDGSQIPQSTFSAVQTTYADSIIASMSSSSASAASSSASASLHPLPTNGPAGLQPPGPGSPFPHWAIAVIAVLGFLAIVASCTLAFFLGIRRRHDNSSNRNSMGSASPMMADVGHAPQSPLLPGGGATQPASVGHHAPSVVSPDGASTISRANSAEAGPFSGADAAIMADAFRKALRKPGFADQPMEEDTPEAQRRQEELLNRELVEEGRGIRSVGSSRGVKVETLSDATHDSSS